MTIKYHEYSPFTGILCGKLTLVSDYKYFGQQEKIYKFSFKDYTAVTSL